MQAVTQVRMHVQKRILKASYFPSLSLTALQEWAKEWAPGWVKSEISEGEIAGGDTRSPPFSFEYGVVRSLTGQLETSF